MSLYERFMSYGRSSSFFPGRRQARAENDLRSVQVGAAGRSDNKHNNRNRHYHSNYISTCKYSVWSFLPKFLYEQFTKVSNLFFLFILIVRHLPGVTTTGHYISIFPLAVIILISAVKEIVEDLRRYVSDKYTNKSRCTVIKNNEWTVVDWDQVHVGDVVKLHRDETAPVDMILLSANNSQGGVAYVRTASLDGETSYKIKQTHADTSTLNNIYDLNNLNGEILCDKPNDQLYSFNATFTYTYVNENKQNKLSLNQDNVLLRGSQLVNTESVIGVTVYTGFDTKLFKNAASAPIKTSHMERTNNRLLLILIVFLLICTTACAVIYQLYYYNYMYLHWYLNILSADKKTTFLLTFLGFLILFHNIVPISLTVNLEMAKFCLSFILNYDDNMKDHNRNISANVKTSNLIEELGQINHIFTDKTGTLTKNVMTLNDLSVMGRLYGGTCSLSLAVKKVLSDRYTEPVVKEDILLMMRHILLCNSVVSQCDEFGNLEYSSSSPDELALIKGVKTCGFEFVSRVHDVVTIRYVKNTCGVSLNNNNESEYIVEAWKIENIFEFSSERKRMSVVARLLSSDDDTVYLFCKGADSVMSNLTTAASFDSEAGRSIMQQTNLFASRGLRTLNFAYKTIPTSVYNDWLTNHFNDAIYSITDRTAKLHEAYARLEDQLILDGLSGVEDELQVGVPQTIKMLRQSKIMIWMLTGDKIDTAINIAYSSNIINKHCDVVILAEKSSQPSTMHITLNSLINNNNNNNNTNKKSSRHVLAVEGGCLPDCLHEQNKRLFLSLLSMSKAVIICRVSASQKEAVVRLVKENVSNAITLAIGDGANDCSMIQAAHVGVGISGGNEGMQAANSSDFSIAQFSYLRTLVLYHGAVSYRKLCNTIYFCYYKNFFFSLIGAFYTFENLHSGHIFFTPIMLTMINFLFTGILPMSLAIFDQPVSSNAYINVPLLYETSQSGKLFNYRRFLLCLFNAGMHSLSLYLLCYYAYAGGVDSVYGSAVTTPSFGMLIYAHYVLIISLKAMIEISCWGWIVHLIIWFGPVTMLLFFSLFCRGFLALHIEPVLYNLDLSLYRSGLFMGTLLLPFVILLPDFIFIAVRNSVFKPTDTIIAEMEKGKHVNWSDKQSVHNAIATVSLIKLSPVSKRYSGFAFSYAEDSFLQRAWSNLISGKKRWLPIKT